MLSYSEHSAPPRSPSPEPVRITVMEGRRALLRFLRLPWRLYADDPAWVPPLILERRQHLSPRNPYFDHARFRAWIAYRGAKPVGRISAQIDRLHLERYKDATGFFGLLEAEDDPEAFRALLSAAETWLRDHGMRRILGPFNLSINQECGLLVEGFDTPPMVMMGHNRTYYAGRIEGEGYGKAKDLVAYRISSMFGLPPAMESLLARAAKRVQVRTLRRDRFVEELRVLQDIFEDAWSSNWGFIPFTAREFDDLGRTLRFLVHDDFVHIAEVDGEPAAMIVAFPNVNEAIRDLNGRLFPWGWLKLAWRLKVRHPRTARVALMGVRKRYHNSRVGAALALLVIVALRECGVRRGVREVELSWILEDNVGTRSIIESLGGVVYKRYRLYEKRLE
ncbi:MAG TPA: GNAT family N-acetyltransferase [Syntrophobacteria bacterium]|nr:GNAT family N-acetyltransferase [Syntrophobacteria bacterium]